MAAAVMVAAAAASAWAQLVLLASLAVAVGAAVAEAVCTEAAGTACRVEEGPKKPQPTWVPKPLPYAALDAAAPEKAGWHVKYHGVVLLRSKATLEEARLMVDGIMQGLGQVRNKMSTPTANGTSLNPRNESSKVSPLRVAYVDNHQLAPADHTVQGPHQEGMTMTRNNRRYVVFYCEEPGDSGGDTALFDMQRAWFLLPPDLQERLRRSSFGHQTVEGDTMPVPAVVKRKESGLPCLQFYCFGKTTHACVDVYRTRTGRRHVTSDPYGYGMRSDADMLLISEDGNTTSFVGPDLTRLLWGIYGAMYEHRWQKGDVIIIDNIRFAHARLEGSGRSRSLRFLTYGPPDKSMNLSKLDRP